MYRRSRQQHKAMDAFHRAPVLQVRDARLTTSRSEVEALKEFFESVPPHDHQSASRNGPTSMSKSTDNRKQGRRKFFSIGKKRLSTSDFEAKPYVYGVAKRASALVPLGATQRNLGEGHTVIMIGSPFPPPAIRSAVKTPTLEITPSSPVMPSQTTSSLLQSQKFSSAEPVLPRLTPSYYSPSPPPAYNNRTHPALSKGHSETPTPNLLRPNLAKSLPETEAKLGATHGQQRDLPSEIPVTSHLVQVLPLSDSSFESAPSSTIPQNKPTRAAKRPFSLILLESHTEKVEQALARARLTKDESLESLETSTAEHPLQPPEQRAANRRAIYKAHSNSSTPRSSKAIPPGLGFPLTPPPSLTAVSVTEQSATSIRPGSSSKKCTKKNKAVQPPYMPVPHGTLIPDPDLVDLEIVDLERMDDRKRAFKELAGMYMQQKKLRAAEEDLQRQKVADLSAGLMAQRMENLKLVHLLRQKGEAVGEIQPVTGFALDVSPLVREASADTLASGEGPNLDPTRFAMLGKEAQFGLIRDFSQSSIATPDAGSGVDDFHADASSTQHLIQRVMMSGPMTLLTPAPSIPLPPLPNARRNTHSIMVSNSAPAFVPATRSRSLTEENIASMPYLDSFVIEQNMRRLERDCGKSRMSVDSSPAVSEDLFDFDEMIGNRGSLSQPEIAGQFSLLGEDAMKVSIEATMGRLSVTEDMSNSGLYISSGLTSSVSTFQTAESSSGVNVIVPSTEVAFQSPAEVLATNNEAATAHDQNPFSDLNDGVLARHTHTVFTTTPSIETFVASPNPRPASVDDSTWGALFMGLGRRAESKTQSSSDGDLERDEASSFRSIEA